LALDTEARHFTSVDWGKPDVRDKLLQNMMAPKILTLKVGAQVMLIKNLDENLVNGTQGTVIGFRPREMKETKHPRDFPKPPDIYYPEVEFHLSNGNKVTVVCEPHEWKVEFPNMETQASRTQIPLILAWALSIHKAQGQTLERVRVNLARVFERGQAYVALSRATSQEGLQILGFHTSKVMAHHRVIEFYNNLCSVDQVMARRANGLFSRLGANGSSDTTASAPKRKMLPPQRATADITVTAAVTTTTTSKERKEAAFAM
jgi:ATP-dependent DNA helicase PIF1